LAGADKHCQMLAQAAGAGGKTWHAYLSTQGAGAVNARDRVGSGPWQNAKGTVIAKNLTELNSASNNITKQTALTEKGELVNGRGDTPNMHDILTGSQPDGTAFAAGDDRTCGNWTKSGQGAAMVGHHDRQGLRDDDARGREPRGDGAGLVHVLGLDDEESTQLLLCLGKGAGGGGDLAGADADGPGRPDPLQSVRGDVVAAPSDLLGVLDRGVDKRL